ncbi:MAG: hypothetical protein IKY43_02145 [Bacteroidales bacterium]|nr:hypothetical protein [Bacteroidales bacterium]
MCRSKAIFKNIIISSLSRFGCSRYCALHISLLKMALCVVLVLGSFSVYSQNNNNMVRLAWWNLENFFDPSNDSLTNDDEFTPEGINHWTYTRFNNKKNNIYKTILSMGLDSLPAAMGVCEVENAWTLKQLCFNTPLAKYGYQYIHYDSPDPRGIDVALVYMPKQFSPIYSKPILVDDSSNLSFKTRDILLVCGTVLETDTLFILLAHFPSKKTGIISVSRREVAAKKLKYTIDTIAQRHPKCGIVVMGDFNDTPLDDCIVKTLGVSPSVMDSSQSGLINLMADIDSDFGTYKYQGMWYCLDQIMISSNLSMKTNSHLPLVVDGAKIHIKDFLLVKDNKFLGNKLYRTYTGVKYEGGFSDHLPIYINVTKKY